MTALALQRGMTSRQLDAKSTFLNAPIDTELYLKPPFGCDLLREAGRTLFRFAYNQDFETNEQSQPQGERTSICVYQFACFYF